MPFDTNEISINSNGGTELQARLLESVIDPDLLSNFQIISSRPRELDETKIRIMSFHDLPNDPEVQNFKDHNFRNKFHHFVFISDWQYQAFNMVLQFPFSLQSSTIEVGFNPISVDWSQKTSPEVRFCYTSTPQRGLSILVPVFAKFAEKHEDVHLDVFSSFKIYGWSDRDAQFEPIFDMIRNHKNMTYHGYAPHDELIDYLKTAHVFAYPCIWPETSCKAMEEAMSAGLLCIHPNVAALPSTSGGLNQMYAFDSDANRHAEIFHHALENGYGWLKNNPQAQQYLGYVKNYADNRYNIAKVKLQWEMLMKGLLQRYPTVESRKIPTDQTWVIDTNQQIRR